MNSAIPALLVSIIDLGRAMVRIVLCSDTSLVVSSPSTTTLRLLDNPTTRNWPRRATGYLASKQSHAFLYLDLSASLAVCRPILDALHTHVVTANLLLLPVTTPVKRCWWGGPTKIWVGSAQQPRTDQQGRNQNTGLGSWIPRLANRQSPLGTCPHILPTISIAMILRYPLLHATAGSRGGDRN